MKTWPIIVLSIVVCLVCGEIFFRSFYPQSQYSVTYAPWGWRHIPNTEVTFWGEKPGWRWNLKPSVKIKYGVSGLRGRAWANPYILILGDSFAEDMGSPDKNLISSYLEDKILLPVMNAGHYGFCNAQELMYYLAEGYKYKPNIVLIFYTGDTANPNYAVMEDGKLKLKWKTFTRKQKLYKNIVSAIRLRLHLGSFILNRLHDFSWFEKIADRGGLNDKIPITNFDTYSVLDDFVSVDKHIWVKFKKEIEKNGSRLIIMNCMGEFTPPERAFFDLWGIEYFEITGLPNPNIKRILDKESGVYDPAFESHRFGYKSNSIVSQKIYDYLKGSLK